MPDIDVGIEGPDQTQAKFVKEKQLVWEYFITEKAVANIIEQLSTIIS